MREGQTLEPTVTGRSCTKEALKSSEQRCSRLAGRRSLPNGPRDPRQSFPSGSVSALAKRLEIPRLQKKRRNKSWVFSSYFEANIRPQSPDVTTKHSIRV